MNKIGLILITISVMAIGCQNSPEERYRKLETAELLKDKLYDSLFFGLYFQMSKEEFSEYCFSMHQKGKFNQGGNKNGSWVECELPDQLSYPGAINFFPEFENDTIVEMNAAVYYKDVQPMKGKSINVDTLMDDVLKMLNTWYGGENINIESPTPYQKDIYVKINGNRRITISPDNVGQMINLWYVDLKKDNARR